jgi:hypothetical protein
MLEACELEMAVKSPTRRENDTQTLYPSRLCEVGHGYGWMRKHTAAQALRSPPLALDRLAFAQAEWQVEC